jgi:hypothetical protein
MRLRFAAWLRRAPHVLGFLVCLFLALFALDSTGVVDALMHLTPVALLLAILAAGWRWPWLGAAGFLGVAVAYAIAAWQHPSWVAVISGPLAVVGVLFVLSGTRRRSAV